ncbi:multifunctional methyltransferase subunit TRM112-like protein [Coccinella septempunctata]|uniref:multifunctional methyltransferase subunit TRM112-like protein n=1 Tax=Coccinella septempunctata TaxID=41139 RepID=UPI001D05C659|nr:multifunctional methyltransferase subunit TRM112-like protein [Coccinella septempunctata]
MKLLTHNMLSSRCLKGVNVGYPLGIKVEEVTSSVVDFNPEFIQRIIPKLEWNVLKEASDTVVENGYLPNELIDNYSSDEDFLKKVHHVLLEVEVIKGNLICPETGRSFPISNGIPNMLLNEDEV